jgi:uncharacterized protein (DUF1778 family)
MARRTESAHVKMTPVDDGLISAAARRVGASTPQYLLTAALEKARKEIPAATVEQIEKRLGGGE